MSYSVMSASMFILLIGWVGIQLNRNVLILLMSMELSILSINFYLVITSFLLDDIGGQILALMSLSMAASETCIALAIFAIYFQVTGKVEMELMNLISM